MRLARRAYLASVGTSAVVSVTGCLGGSDVPEYDCDGETPDEPVSDLPRPVLGDPDADVVVAAHEDFSCPACGQWKTDEFPTIKAEYVDPGTIRYEHWDFPIPVTEWSAPVANAARGVQDRDGDEAFFEFARVAYEHQDAYSRDAIAYAADEAGSDPCAAGADAEFGTYEAVLSNDRDEGERRGVDATPTVFVNDERVSAVADDIAEAIESAR